MELCLGSGKSELVCYTDSDLGGNLDNSKSNSGCLITFGGGAISCQLRLQKCIALSTTEAEYIAITEGAKESLWMKEFIKDLDFEQSRFVLFCDNQSLFISPSTVPFILSPSILVENIIGLEWP